MQFRHLQDDLWRPNRGMLIIDLAMAFAIASIFAFVMSESLAASHRQFAYAHERKELLDAYASSSSPFRILVAYGNERAVYEYFASSSKQSIEFVDVEKKESDDRVALSGQPLCAVRFGDSSMVGTNRYSVTGPGQSASTTIALKTIRLPIPASNALTHVEVRDGIAYVSADSNASLDPDLYIVDINDKDHARVLSSLNTGPGIVSFALAGNYIYAAAASTAFQLHIVRIDRLDSMSLASRYRLPAPYATATMPTASAIAYDSGHVFLGTDKWDGYEFLVIDASNPGSPSYMSGIEIGAKANDIYSRDMQAYISSSAQSQLITANMADASSPVIVDIFQPSGWQRQEGRDAYSFEGSYYFGRTSGGFDIPTDYEYFASASDRISGSSDARNMPGGIYGIIADKERIYAASRQAGKEFLIFDRESTSTSAYPLPSLPQSLTCDGSKLYALSHAGSEIYEITIHDE